MSGMKVHINIKDKLFIEETLKRAGSKEVGILGTIVYDNDGEAHVSNLYIPPQTVSGSEVDWGNDGLLDFIDFLWASGFREDSYGIYSAHSHNNMGVFWSATDESFIREAGKQGAPYLVSSVFNNKGEAKHRLDVFNDVSNIPMLERDNVQITWEEDDDVELVICHSKKIAKAQNSFDKIMETLEAKKVEIEKEYEEAINTAKGRINHLVDNLRNEAKSQALSLYEKNVTEHNYIRSVTIGGRAGIHGGGIDYTGAAWNDDWYNDADYWKNNNSNSIDGVDKTAGMKSGIVKDPNGEDNFSDCVEGELYDYFWDSANSSYVYGNESGDLFYITLQDAKSNNVMVYNCDSNELENVTVEDYLDSCCDGGLDENAIYYLAETPEWIDLTVEATTSGN